MPPKKTKEEYEEEEKSLEALPILTDKQKARLCQVKIKLKTFTPTQATLEGGDDPDSTPGTPNIANDLVEELEEGQDAAAGAARVVAAPSPATLSTTATPVTPFFSRATQTLSSSVRTIANSLFSMYEGNDAEIEEAVSTLFFKHDLHNSIGEDFREKVLREIASSIQASKKAVSASQGSVLTELWRFPAHTQYATALIKLCKEDISPVAIMLGQKSNIDASYSYISNNILDSIRKKGVNDSTIAKWMILILEGSSLPERDGIDTKDVAYELAKVLSLMIICEPMRNKAALIQNRMILELIAENIITWKTALDMYTRVEKTKVKGHGGLSPMSMYGAVKSSRTLDQSFSSGRYIAEDHVLLNREADIVRLWLCYKRNMKDLARKYALSHSDQNPTGIGAEIINSTIGSTYRGGQVVHNLTATALNDWYGAFHYDIPALSSFNAGLINFKPQRISSDGNCMYNAVIAAMSHQDQASLGETSEERMKELRKRVAQKVKDKLGGAAGATIIANIKLTVAQHPEYFGNDEDDAIDFYISTIIGTPGTYNWGDQLTLEIIAELYQIEIYVHGNNLPVLNHGAPNGEIHLYHHAEAHYDAYVLTEHEIQGEAYPLHQNPATTTFGAVDLTMGTASAEEIDYSPCTAESAAVESGITGIIPYPSHIGEIGECLGFVEVSQINPLTSSGNIIIEDILCHGSSANPCLTPAPTQQAHPNATTAQHDELAGRAASDSIGDSFW